MLINVGSVQIINKQFSDEQTNFVRPSAVMTKIQYVSP